MIRIPALACLLLAASPLLAAPPLAARDDPLPAGTTRCRIWAYTTDRDPEGLPVHARPSRGAPRVARLPRAGGEVRDETLFEVIGHRGGWLLIENAFNPAEGRQPGVEAYKRRGWVPADLVGLRVESPVLRAAPRKDAPVAAQLPQTAGLGAARWGGTTVLACSDEWVRVKTERGTGWAARTCGNPVESCP